MSFGIHLFDLEKRSFKPSRLQKTRNIAVTSSLPVNVRVSPMSMIVNICICNKDLFRINPSTRTETCQSNTDKVVQQKDFFTRFQVQTIVIPYYHYLIIRDKFLEWPFNWRSTGREACKLLHYDTTGLLVGASPRGRTKMKFFGCLNLESPGNLSKDIILRIGRGVVVVGIGG